MIAHLKPIAIAFAVTLLILGTAQAADDLRALQQRFKDRYPKLVALKHAGKVGETIQGYVEAVRSEYAAEVNALVTEENKDRRTLYEHLAKEEGISVQDVAKNNAARNFQKADSGDYLKGPDGKWKQKP